MKTVAIEARGLVLLSGPSGSGKTRMVHQSNISPEMVVSSDEIRLRVFGSQVNLIDGSLREEPSDTDDNFIFSMMESIVDKRLQHGLLTFVDATLLNDESRSSFVKIAKKHKSPCYTIIFDLPEKEVIENNAARFNESHYNSTPVSEQVVRRQLERFQRESKISQFLAMTEPFTVQIKPVSLEDHNLAYDIVGDTHGLYAETLELLRDQGYLISDNGMRVGIEHPLHRKLIVLGDFCDRGDGDLEMIRFMMAAHRQGHHVLMGNHENKLKRALSEYLETSKIPSVPAAALKVMSRIMDLDNREQRAILSFLESLPHYFIVDKYAFCHAPVSYFNPLKTSFGKCVYGSRRDDFQLITDHYDALFTKGHNNYVLIHGHTPHEHDRSEYIFSMDNHVGYGGDIHFLKLDEFDRQSEIMGSYRSAFNDGLIIKKSGFDFEKESKGPIMMYREIRALGNSNSNNRLFDVRDGHHGMMIIKYSKNVHFKNLWDRHPMLMKARGLVLDCAGNILQHPFDKCFNYKENGAGAELSHDTPVVCPVKLNGFLGVVSAHPYRTGEMLHTTTGSFESDYVELFKESFTEQENRGMARYTGKNRDMTLMFEVIHKDDPHIIQYPESMQGVHLIGARHKNMSAMPLTEAELDDIAMEIGVRRPSWEKTTFGEILEKNKTFNDEGFMVRLDTENQETVLKLKSPLYLSTKYLGRLVDHRAEFMFKKTELFCQNIDEEGVMLVKLLTSKFTYDEWKEMNQHDRVSAVMNVVSAMIG